jgi:aspartyl protease family protein
MKPGNFLWLGFAAAMFVAFVPRAHEHATTHRKVVRSEVPPPPPSSASAKALAWYADETTIDRAPDGHFYADANVEGMPVHFLVDTGSTTVALTGSDASNAGLSWDDDQLRIVAKGASGPVYGVPATLNSVSLGDFTRHDVAAVIVPQGLPVSLLGQSFLSQFGKLDISGDRMTLGGTQ